MTIDAEGQGGFNPRPVLVVFVRLLAVVFLIGGLYQWTIILGPLGSGPGLNDIPVEFRVAAIFFSVFDLVAAVGLWLLSSWGAVVWLIAALTEIALHTFFASIFGPAPVTVAFHAVSIVIYTTFTYLVERSSES
ncbi:DUF6163 family protein [Hartmannibacter diazotrophicus]|nr:DUF6163 family protein [Hartmannibacter diazotrophicus]